MNAVEFIKRYGWDIAKLYANGWITFNSGCVENDVSRESVKQLVDAWELVQLQGGIDEAKKIINYPNFLNDIDADIVNRSLKQAIKLVESVK